MSATTCTELPILPHDIYLLTLPYLDIPALLALKDASRDLSDAVRPLLLECLLLSGVGHSGDRLRVFEALKKGSDRGNESGALPEVAEGEADGGHAVELPAALSLPRLFLYSLARPLLPPPTQPQIHPSIHLPSKNLTVTASHVFNLHNLIPDFLIHELGPPPERYTTTLEEWLLYDPESEWTEMDEAFRKECGRAGRGRSKAWESYEAKRLEATRTLRADLARVWSLLGKTFPFTRDENALRKSRRALASPPPPAPSSSTNPIARLPNIHADKKGRPHVDLEGPEFWDPDHGGHGKNPKYATPPRAPVRKWSDDPELIPAWRRSRKTDALIEKMEKGEVGTKRKKKVVGTAEEPEEARGDGSGRPVGAAKKDRGSRGIYSR